MTLSSKDLKNPVTHALSFNLYCNVNTHYRPV